MARCVPSARDRLRRRAIRHGRSGSSFRFRQGEAFDAVGRPLADKMKPLLGTVVIEISARRSSLGAPPSQVPNRRLHDPARRDARRTFNEALLKRSRS